MVRWRQDRRHAPIGGTFTLTDGEQTTEPIAHDATAAAVQAAQGGLGGDTIAQIAIRYVDRRLWKKFRLECIERDMGNGELLGELLRERYAKGERTTMTGNFWQHYERAGYVELADAEGNTVRVDLCKDGRGRLGVVLEAPAYSAKAGRLTADYGPSEAGFASVADARAYAEQHLA